MWSVVGHESTVRALSRALDQGRTAHAYLFIGPKGVGKAHLALNLAQALNCTAMRKPCGECAQCLRTMTLKHADVQMIDLPKAADGTERKTIPIDDIRDMQQSAGLQPFEGGYKIFIIDGADALSGAAANRLLKTLEEPPAGVVLILLAVDEDSILETILSRCQTFRLRPIPRQKIETHLVAKLGIEPGRARLLSSLAGGSMGWALEAGHDEALLEERQAALEQIIALASQPLHERMETARALAEDFTRRREDIYAWLGLSSQLWRDVILIKGGQAASVTNVDRRDALAALAEGSTLEEIARVLRAVATTGGHLRQNANPRLALDVLMLEVPQISAAASKADSNANLGQDV